MSVDNSPLRARTPATRISPYLNRVSPTTAALGTSCAPSMKRTSSRLYAGPATSPLATPSSLRDSHMDASSGYGAPNIGPPVAPVVTNAYATQGSLTQEGVAPLPYTHNKRDSFHSMQSTSPTLFSKLGTMHRRESSSSPSSVMDKSERLTVRSNGFKMTKMNSNLFDSEETPMNIPLLDPARESQHNTWRLLYAEMMYSWGLFEARTELLKFLTLKQPMNSRNKDDQSMLERVLGLEKRGPQLFNKCFECESRLFPSYKCDFCKQMRIGIKCIICHISVRGRTSVCLKCAHGGHTEHLWEWFVQEKNNVCPTGCGCECLVNYGGWAGGGVVVEQNRKQQQVQDTI
ncbi:GATOR complex protein wdr59 [Entomortierella chlamydospora]|nr:GATOR complex protein wdr59 [Entomortierella chlamydospora]